MSKLNSRSNPILTASCWPGSRLWHRLLTAPTRSLQVVWGGPTLTLWRLAVRVLRLASNTDAELFILPSLQVTIREAEVQPRPQPWCAPRRNAGQSVGLDWWCSWLQAKARLRRCRLQNAWQCCSQREWLCSLYLNVAGVATTLSCSIPFLAAS